MKKQLILTTLCAFTVAALCSCGGKKEDDGNNSTPGGATLGAGTEGGVLIEELTELPDELIEGTPKPIKLPVAHDDPKAAPQFKVPEGTTLLSKGKPVTSSDDMPIIGDLTLITDGDKEAGEGYYVELLNDLQWVQIDLEKESEIYAIWVWHFHSQKRAYHDVIVQISNDAEFKDGVTTVYNNDYDDSAGMGKGGYAPYAETRYGLVVDGKATKGRYVRLYSRGNTSNEMNHYIEVEVFGK